jgi:hypothetical protein
MVFNRKKVIKLFDFEDGSIESEIIRLQSMGLTLNELKNVNGKVTYAAYESLLEYTICLLQDFEEYTKKVQRLIN